MLKETIILGETTDFVLHQILQHVSSSELRETQECR
jgi:hypothetical protein